MNHGNCSELRSTYIRCQSLCQPLYNVEIYCSIVYANLGLYPLWSAVYVTLYMVPCSPRYW